MHGIYQSYGISYYGIECLLIRIIPRSIGVLLGELTGELCNLANTSYFD